MIDLVRVIITEVKEGVIKRFSGRGRAGETLRDRELLQHYGFTSRPLSGSEGIVLKKGNVVFLLASDDRRYRIKLEDGEVALYTDEGDHIHFRRGRQIHVACGNKVVVDAGEDVEVNTKRAVLNAAESAQVNAPAVEVSCDTLQAAASQQAVLSAPLVSLAAASITVSPQAGGGAASARITADIDIEGDLSVEGTLTLTGSASISGNLEVGGNIHAGGSVTNNAGGYLHKH